MPPQGRSSLAYAQNWPVLVDRARDRAPVRCQTMPAGHVADAGLPRITLRHDHCLMIGARTPDACLHP